MYILGITHPLLKNGSACLLKDGKIVAFAEEERFNRIKHSINIPPRKSINYCLTEGGINLEKIDYFAVGYDKFTNVFLANLKNSIPTFFKRLSLSKELINYQNVYDKRWSNFRLTLLDYFSTHYEGLLKLPFDFFDKRVIFVRHHIAHASSAFYVSPFKKACIVSVDGGGGQEAGILAVGEGNDIKILKTIPSAHSLGHLYSTFTTLLGFLNYSEEGKVMGLSSYGDSDAKILPFVTFKDGTAQIDSQEMMKFIKEIMPRLRKDPLYKVNRNLAASLQRTIEKAYVYMAENLYKETGIRNFCLTGGVSLNCIANTKVLKLNFVDDVFVQPASHDAGTALGAALKVYVEKTGRRPGFIMEHVYYGPGYTNEDIEKVIKKAEIKYWKKLKNTEKTTAKLLAKGKIIGWFQGRMEVGPRALGGRSILANPSIPEMKDILNIRVKGREPWRPFAPSILEEYSDRYLLDVKKSPFMILESRVAPEKKKEIIAAVHVDNTVRPQTVSKKISPRYWKLINEFRKITKIPALLNTSFNLAGEPIVCSPQDAISAFFRSGMDFLIIEDYILAKEPIRIT